MNWTFHLTLGVAQKLNVVYCLYFEVCEILTVILIQNLWKDTIFLQRTKVKSLPQDDDAKDDVAGEYELEMYFKLQESSDDTIGSRVNIENHDDAQDW